MGHFGCDKTFATLSKNYFWPKMFRDVSRYTNQCSTCRKTKSQDQSHGLYMPVHVPYHPWEDISMDFVLGLPRTENGKDSVFVLADRFSKMAHFLPCHKIDEILQISFIGKYCIYMECERLLSWTATSSSLATFGRLYAPSSESILFSSAHHPKTDGQTEVTNQTLSTLLRMLIKKNIKEWEECLPIDEYA